MKKLLIAIGLILAMNSNAQNITFAGDGLSTVKIENLTKSASLIVNPGDILTLSGTTSIMKTGYPDTQSIYIYPNPVTYNSVIEIIPPVSGDAVIEVYEVTGKQVIRIKTYLETAGQKFSISGTMEGLYLINVEAASYRLSGKFVSSLETEGTPRLTRQGGEITVHREGKSFNDHKGALENSSILYSAGDILKFTGTSGNSTTIIMTGKITQDTTITFTFTACADGDGNNYPVVMIGNRLWMAKNLKTTKYNNGTSVPLVTDPGTWGSLATPGFCWYNNNETTYNDPYGALYNAYTIGAGNVCPAGWHVPTDTEWSGLTTSLGGESMAGGKLKETGTTHWTTPNDGATDEAGFAAVAGGARTLTGAFDFIGGDGHWWTSTEENSEYWIRYISNNWTGVSRISVEKPYGLSVRCIKDYIIETEAAINDTLDLCYAMLNEYIENTYLFDAVYANKVTAPNSSWSEIYNHSQNPENQKVSLLWFNAYEIIYKTNLIITSAAQVITDPSARALVTGQAKAMRAYLYHNLLIWFGELPVETGYSASLIPRNSVAEVLAFIKLDANNAAISLPAVWSAPDNFRLTRDFANGLLSRTWLFSKSYTEAMSPSSNIINSGSHALSADTLNFTSSNSEIFWGFNKSADPVFSPFFYKGVYVPVIRYTESFLISAECLLNTGNASSALTFINILISRRSGTQLTINDLTNDVIYSWWRKELAKEGNMFITMNRFGKALAAVQGMPHKLLLPVPMAILIANPYLTQNPGY